MVIVSLFATPRLNCGRFAGSLPHSLLEYFSLVLGIASFFLGRFGFLEGQSLIKYLLLACLRVDFMIWVGRLADSVDIH
jgi:hypothetical protein